MSIFSNNKQRTLKEIQDEVMKLDKNFSYRLHISLNPDWYNIYRRCNPDQSKEKQNEFIDEMNKKMKDSNFADSVLWGRNYNFTEFYDSTSGLTILFQEMYYTYPHENLKKTFSIVDKFGDLGYLIEKDKDIESIKDFSKQNEKRRKWIISTDSK